MKRIYCLILAGTLFVGLLLSFPFSTVVSAEVAELKQGQELFQAGDLNQALAVLRGFVQQSPDSIETAQASALIGRILLSNTTMLMQFSIYSVSLASLEVLRLSSCWVMRW